MSLEVVQMPLSALKEYEGNAKIHDDANVEAIRASIRRFGMCDPIGVWTNPQGEVEIVEGHGRKMALEAEGYEVADVIFLDHLTDEERRAYALAHNQTTMMSDFDLDILEAELDLLADFDMGDFGFDVAEETDPVEVVEDEVPEDAPALCKVGDVWQLGRHRLMCGDSTDADSVAKLMDGNRADVCFTSPPYNMGKSTQDKGPTGWSTAPNDAMRQGYAYGSFSDALSDDEYTNLLCMSLDNALNHCDDALFNIGILAASKRSVAEMLYTHREKLCDIVVWNKSQSMPHGMRDQRGWLSHRCELVFGFNQNGSRAFTHPQWEKGAGINRIDTGNASGNEYAKVHSATFPVEFAAEVVRNFTEKSVLDLFGGTGTTLIAAEQLNRTCYMMELDPHYCDVIIERWQNLTGETARKVA